LSQLFNNLTKLKSNSNFNFQKPQPILKDGFFSVTYEAV
jgi:hypothetical protein